jgi:hypothetical protein
MTITPAQLRKLLHYDKGTGQFYWKAIRAGHVYKSTGYEAIRLNGKTYLSHRLAWLYTFGRWPKHEIDHVNRRPTDNRIRNLREATRSQNACNMSARVTSSTKIKGIFKNHKRWSAVIWHLGKAHYLGTFDTKKQAGLAYNKASRKYHGVFRKENTL